MYPSSAKISGSSLKFSKEVSVETLETALDLPLNGGSYNTTVLLKRNVALVQE